VNVNMMGMLTKMATVPISSKRIEFMLVALHLNMDHPLETYSILLDGCIQPVPVKFIGRFMHIINMFFKDRSLLMWFVVKVDAILISLVVTQNAYHVLITLCKLCRNLLYIQLVLCYIISTFCIFIVFKPSLLKFYYKSYQQLTISIFS